MEWVKNISDRQLTDIKVQVLAKGMNYNTKDADPLDFIAELESFFKNNREINKDSRDHIRHEVTNGLLRHKTRPN